MATQSSPQPVATPAASALPQQSLQGSPNGPESAGIGLLGASGSAGLATGGRGETKPAEPAQRGVETGAEAAFGDAGQRSMGLRLSAACARLPVSLAVTVPVREFRVRTLLAMAPGEIVETQWGHGEDLPLASGDVQVAWSEFEVIDTRLAVRVTRLA